jgi:diadenosine tetraphosphate (Ap4A) HIT family hydrolase
MISMEDCIFCKIVEGKIPCHKIYEDEGHLAFLDIFPNTKGMALVIPKKHFDSYAFDMPKEDYLKLLNTSRKVGKFLDKALGTQRTAMVMEGMGINHAHIKLYPLHGIDKKFEKKINKQVKFFEQYEGYIATFLGPRANDEELNKLAAKIRSVVEDV